MKTSTLALLISLGMLIAYTITNENCYYYGIMLFASTALICSAIEDNKTKK